MMCVRPAPPVPGNPHVPSEAKSTIPIRNPVKNVGILINKRPIIADNRGLTLAIAGGWRAVGWFPYNTNYYVYFRTRVDDIPSRLLDDKRTWSTIAGLC